MNASNRAKWPAWLPLVLLSAALLLIVWQFKGDSPLLTTAQIEGVETTVSHAAESHTGNAGEILSSADKKVSSLILLLALLHVLFSSKVQAIGHRYKEGTIQENLFHLLGDAEVAIAVWMGAFLLYLIGSVGLHDMIAYSEGLKYTEPLFVGTILVVAATRPIRMLVQGIFAAMARVLTRYLKVPRELAFYFCALVVGPTLGSFITEPAAMTVTAMALIGAIIGRYKLSSAALLVTIGVLFVNVSIGGTWIQKSAPAIVMVAETWGWDVRYMVENFGYKAGIATVINALVATLWCWKELADPAPLQDPQGTGDEEQAEAYPMPWWMTVAHVLMLGGVVAFSHHPVIFLLIGAFFIGWCKVTWEYQDQLKLGAGLLVALFLTGLVVLGSPQRWWIEPVLQSLPDTVLYLVVAGLTMITDNAAITYIASQVPGLAGKTKYLIGAGAVAAGGATPVANAPNPIGVALLRDYFPNKSVSIPGLFLYSSPFTAVAMAAFWYL